ncbi:MAG: hypothetical protein F6K26_24820 [Moorea sp. SIO2I5]|nr:hypothetical protein [Moorena sp. SIO2I5]
MGILRGSDAARSWGGSAVLGVPPTRALPWFPPLALCIKTLASCQFHAYFRAGRMPTLLLFIPKFSNAEFLPIPYSLVLQPNR